MWGRGFFRATVILNDGRGGIEKHGRLVRLSVSYIQGTIAGGGRGGIPPGSGGSGRDTRRYERQAAGHYASERDQGLVQPPRCAGYTGEREARPDS